MKFSLFLIFSLFPFSISAQCSDSLIKRTHGFKERFQLLDSCVTVTGKVKKVRRERDGDIFILIKPDESFRHLLNEGNIKDQKSCLVVEMVCVTKVKHKILQPLKMCEGYVNKIPKPSKYKRIRVKGPLVLDKPHGWIEIHPASQIELIE